MRKADLHMHSYFSDGAFSPEELVLMAKEAGLSCIALTDHDTVRGNKALLEAGKKHDFEVIPGVELSTDHGEIIGLFVDSDHPAIIGRTEEACRRLETRALKSLELVQAAGYDVSVEELRQRNPNSIIDVQHIARLMVEKGYADDYWSFYVSNIKLRGRFHVPIKNQPVAGAIRAVKAAGGFAVLPHPWLDDYRYVFDNIDEFVSMGLGGIEEMAGQLKPPHFEEVVAEARKLAKENDLILTKGSDFHNKTIGSPLGTVFCDYSVVEEIKRRLGR